LKLIITKFKDGLISQPNNPAGHETFTESEPILHIIEYGKKRYPVITLQI